MMRATIIASAQIEMHSVAWGEMQLHGSRVIFVGFLF